MPRFDGTGPNGQGPMTGRGMGECNRGFGRSRGRGFGFRRRFCPFAGLTTAQPTQQERIEALKAYKKELEAEIETLEKEIK